MPNYLTPFAYAALCGVTHQAIHQRILRGTLVVVVKNKPDGTPARYIDADQYPPKKREPGRKKNK